MIYRKSFELTSATRIWFFDDAFCVESKSKSGVSVFNSNGSVLSVAKVKPIDIAVSKIRRNNLIVYVLSKKSLVSIVSGARGTSVSRQRMEQTAQSISTRNDNAVVMSSSKMLFEISPDLNKVVSFPIGPICQVEVIRPSVLIGVVDATLMRIVFWKWRGCEQLVCSVNNWVVGDLVVAKLSSNRQYVALMIRDGTRARVAVVSLINLKVKWDLEIAATIANGICDSISFVCGCGELVAFGAKTGILLAKPSGLELKSNMGALRNIAKNDSSLLVAELKQKLILYEHGCTQKPSNRLARIAWKEDHEFDEDNTKTISLSNYSNSDRHDSTRDKIKQLGLWGLVESARKKAKD